MKFLSSLLLVFFIGVVGVSAASPAVRTGRKKWKTTPPALNETQIQLLNTVLKTK
jgi:hypothetical protein